METRKLAAEALGTAMLVFFAVGTATLSFGFGVTGDSASAGVVTTAFAFGLALLTLAYAIGSISGCHINPAVTIGALVARRISVRDAVGYWIAQVVGGIIGALLLWIVVRSAKTHTSKTGLGADGWGTHSMIGINAGGAFLAEVILTFLFVFVVLCVTRNGAWERFAAIAVGLALTTVHLVGIPLTGTSVNPARSIASAVFAGNGAMGQLWLFIVAPLIGGVLAALATNFFFGYDADTATTGTEEENGE
jgi:aquaporin Z